jgi:3-mercaptopyruvate sulfurtransferase SseA
MTRSDMEAKIRTWASEFTELASESVPEAFVKYMANRLTEHGISQEDPDIIAIQTPDGRFSARVEWENRDAGVVCVKLIDTGETIVSRYSDILKNVDPSQLAKALDTKTWSEANILTSVSAKVGAK